VPTERLSFHTAGVRLNKLICWDSSSNQWSLAVRCTAPAD